MYFLGFVASFTSQFSFVSNFFFLRSLCCRFKLFYQSPKYFAFVLQKCCIWCCGIYNGSVLRPHTWWELCVLFISVTDSTLHSASLYRGFSALTFYNTNALPVNYVGTKVACSLLRSFFHCVHVPPLRMLSSVQMTNVCRVCSWTPERQQSVQGNGFILKSLYQEAQSYVRVFSEKIWAHAEIN